MLGLNMSTLKISEQAKGLILTLIGVLAVVPDSILIRLINADILTITFWRALIPGLIISLGVLLFYRRQTVSFVKSPGLSGIIFVISFALGNILFVISIELTKVANALFILSTSPIYAMLISRFFLSEPITFRMLLTIFGALLGIGIITIGTNHEVELLFLGDLSALGGALCLAISLTSARSASNFSMIPAIGISSLILALCIVSFIQPFNLERLDWIYILLLGGFFTPIAVCLIHTGPRFISSSEVSLLMLLEAILAPILAWYILSEYPGLKTIIGGLIVLTVLITSNFLAFKKVKK